jgi:AcrR family transcriptional regulator
VEKTKYHHGDLGQALVDAAYELVREGGANELSLRAVCRKVGVTAAAAYHHFADREALLRAVAGKALGDLAAAVRDSLARIPATAHRRRLVGISRAYVNWALDEPHLFRLALGPQRRYPGEPVNSEPLSQLTDALDALLGDGTLSPDHRRGAGLAIWSATHGVASLLSDGPLQSSGGRAAELRMCDLVVETVIRGLLRD